MSPGRRRYLFVHLQKTGGTALLRRLRHHFDPQAVYPVPEEQGTPEVVLDVDRLVGRIDEVGDQIEVITGHFPLCVADVLPGPISAFTVLRDPVERTLSFLRHQREVEPRFAEATLEEIYADPISASSLVANHMVRMLSLTADEMTDGALTAVVVDDARLATARRNLAERIEVMGLQEHFEVFCADLQTTYGWDLGPAVFMNRTARAGAAASLRAEIRADNDHDVRLYELAVELWHQRHPDAS